MDAVIAFLIAVFVPLVVFLRVLVLLVIVDIVLGIVKALRTGTFEWNKLGQFYTSMVIPYFFGWLVFALVVPMVFKDLAVLGEFSELFGEGTVTFAWLFLVGSLVKSIMESFKAIYDRELP